MPRSQNCLIINCDVLKAELFLFRCKEKSDDVDGDQPPNRSRGHSHKGTKLNRWDSERMHSALAEWSSQKFKSQDERLGVRQLARAWDLPHATFRKRITNSYKGHRHLSGRPTVLSLAAEDELAGHLRTLSSAGFPCTRRDVKQLV